ncbi:MAG TPA: NUDIX domain-containing protein [Candidatus Paceibacterota bacterium]|jgi:8-oxo-dGTP pyrophosphatase MutT (NUDIX family)|nr:NUDIX domain-containing protein [Candidatus Paceibacterota bacterium]
MPEVTRSAGGIVLGDHGTVALVRNRKDTLWFFPKGHVEQGETDEDAARREILEEAGIAGLELIDDLGSYVRPRIFKDGTYSAAELKEIHMFLFAAPLHTELAPSMEIEESKWVSLSHVSESLEDAKDRAWFVSVFERVRQAVQRD